MVNSLTKAEQVYGSFRAHLAAIFITIIGIVLIVLCIKGIISSNKYNNTTVATIIDADCNKINTEDTIKYNCSLDVNYTIDNTKFENNINTTSSYKYKVGDTLNLGYNKNDKNDISLDFKIIRWVSIIGIILITMIMIGTYANLYIVRKNKTIAGVEGAVSFVRDITRK